MIYVGVWDVFLEPLFLQKTRGSGCVKKPFFIYVQYKTLVTLELSRMTVYVFTNIYKHWKKYNLWLKQVSTILLKNTFNFTQTFIKSC